MSLVGLFRAFEPIIPWVSHSETTFALIGIAVIALEVFNPLAWTSYSGSQLCEVTPLLTTVQVAYGGDIMNIEKTLSSSTFDPIDLSG